MHGRKKLRYFWLNVIKPVYIVVIITKIRQWIWLQGLRGIN